MEAYYVLHEDNVIVSPHLAYYTKDASERILDIAVDEIKHFLTEGKPVNIAQ